MTTKEAITVLAKMMHAQHGEGLTRRIDAIRLGIEALKEKLAREKGEE